MAEPDEHAYADSDVPWEEEELDENESEYFSTDIGAPAHSANENMTDALRFNHEKFIIAAQYIAKQRAKLHHQLRNSRSLVFFGNFRERQTGFILPSIFVASVTRLCTSSNIPNE